MSEIQIELFESENNHTEELVMPKNEQNMAELTPYDVDQRVFVLPLNKVEMDIEDYYYLKDFENKRGFVARVHNDNKRLCYTVEFGNKQGVFYHEDLQPC